MTGGADRHLERRWLSGRGYACKLLFFDVCCPAIGLAEALLIGA
jgi:hypothetical protein